MNLEQAQSQIDDIDEHGRRLTDWEADFIDRMLKQLDLGIPPSRKQEAIINRLGLDRCAANGQESAARRVC